MMIILACLVVGAGAALVVVGFARSHPAVDAIDYLQTLDDHGAPDEFEQKLEEPFFGRVVRPVLSRTLTAMGRITQAGQRDRIHHQLVLAGLDANLRAEEFLAIRIITIVVGVMVGIGLALIEKGQLRLVLFILGPVVGYLLPQSWLTRHVKERQEAIFLDMPDIVDLLAISVEAGVGFEGAMEIVCNHFNSPLALEFSRTLKEMELGLGRRDALQNLKHRTEVPELSNFVLALVQADALGMPVGRVLHTQAQEMRNKRRQWAREKAGKLPVKILFPLVLFIFPAIMIVVLGPAASTIGRSLR